MAKYERDVISWITVNGNHIPIKPGQTVEQAVNERFDDTDDVEIDVETEDLDKEIESDTLYYFSGFDPHEVTKEEYEKAIKENPRYYETMQLLPETAELMKSLLTDENIDNYTRGQLVSMFRDKIMFDYSRGERGALVSRFRKMVENKYKEKAQTVLKSIPKAADHSSEYALKQNANGYVESMDKPYKSKERKAYTWNCQRCVIAYEMRRRGYDVEAGAYDESDNLGIYHNNLFRSFLNFKLDMVHGYDRRPDGELYSSKGALFKAMETDMKKEPAGSRFILEWDWKCDQSGHTLNAENINGEIIIYDSQNGKSKPLKEYLNEHPNIRPRTINWVRTNDLELSGDLEGVVKWKK